MVHVDTQELTEHIDELGMSFSRLAAALVITGMIVGSALVTSQLWQSDTAERVLPDLALGVFVVLLIGGARLIWGLLHPPRRPYVE